jgi:emopamil binding protein
VRQTLCRAADETDEGSPVTTTRTRRAIPLRRRPVDIVLIAFFAVNLGFITYLFDIEQLTVANPRRFRYPLWPPAPIVDLVHWWGRHNDPLLMARPAFFRMTIWIDVLLFGPFYAAAIYAFIRGREWIKPWALVWSGMMMSNVLIILLEERHGIYATPHWGTVFAANLPWLLLPVAVIARLVPFEHPFTAPAPSESDVATSRAQVSVG